MQAIVIALTKTMHVLHIVLEVALFMFHGLLSLTR